MKWFGSQLLNCTTSFPYFEMKVVEKKKRSVSLIP